MKVLIYLLMSFVFSLSSDVEKLQGNRKSALMYDLLSLFFSLLTLYFIFQEITK